MDKVVLKNCEDHTPLTVTFRVWWMSRSDVLFTLLNVSSGNSLKRSIESHKIFTALFACNDYNIKCASREHRSFGNISSC